MASSLSISSSCSAQLKRSSGGARVVTCSAGKKQAAPKQQAQPSPAVLKALGAVAAVQIAFTGAACAGDLKDLLPPSATSSAARAERNRETSAAPSLNSVGDALKGQFNTNDPKEVGKALDRATPDVDLTKRPNELIQDAKKSVKNSLPNLSVADPSPQSVLPKTANPFDKSGIIPIQDNLDDLRKEAAETKNSALGKAGEKAGQLGPGQVGDAAKDAANEAGKRASQVLGNVSLDIPNPFSSEAERDIKKAAAPIQDADSKISELGRKLDPTTGYSKDVGNAVQAKSEQAKKSTQQVRKQVLGDVSLSNPFASKPEKLDQEAKSAVKDAGKNVANLGNKLPSPSELGDAAKAKGKEATRNVKETAGNLSDAFEKLNVPNPFDSSPAKGTSNPAPSVTEASKGLGRALNVDDVERSLPEFPSPVELAKADRGEAQAAAERFGGETGGKLPKPDLGKLPNLPTPDLNLPSVNLPSAGAALDKVKGAADKAQNALPNLSLNLDPKDALNKAQGAAKDASKGLPDLPSAGDVKGKLPDVKGKLPDISKSGAPGSKTTASDLGIPKNS